MEKWKTQPDSKDNFFQRSYLRPLFMDMRCPECRKLYRVDTRDIISNDPHFDCIQCGVTFGVEMDPASPRKLITKTSNKVLLSKLSTQDLSPEAIKRCPKCASSNLKTSTECCKCGIIFERYERSEREGGVLPSVAKAWTELLQDYNNLTKHLAFVDQCEELQAVPYALKKYQELKELQPFDEIANKMHGRVLVKSFSRRSVEHIGTGLKKMTWLMTTLTFLKSRPWGKYITVVTWTAPLLFILWGSFSAELRNLIGFGVSLLFLRIAAWIFVGGHRNFEKIWKL